MLTEDLQVDGQATASLKSCGDLLVGPLTTDLTRSLFVCFALGSSTKRISAMLWNASVRILSSVHGRGQEEVPHHVRSSALMVVAFFSTGHFANTVFRYHLARVVRCVSIGAVIAVAIATSSG